MWRTRAVSWLGRRYEVEEDGERVASFEFTGWSEHAERGLSGPGHPLLGGLAPRHHQATWLEVQYSSSKRTDPPVLTGDIENPIDRIWDAFWRDRGAMSVLLAGFTPDLSDPLDSEALYRGI